MINYRMTIAYEGTRYDGWQRQNNSQNTIQGKLERCLTDILGETITINGAGRTDAGVHAIEQVANFQTSSDISPVEIRSRLCTLLPEDIAVTALIKAEDRFHARLNAKGKVYQYGIYLDQASPVFDRKFVFHHSDPIDIKYMKQTSEFLIGTHDFALFNDNKKIKKSTVRTIYSIDFEQTGNELKITFTGDGFMYHMIRRIMGMLIHAGERREIPKDIFHLTKWPVEWPLAPAKGLTLVKVIY